MLLYRCEDNWTRELTFQRKYGHLVALDWVDPVHLLVAFSSGCIVTVSTRTWHTAGAWCLCHLP